MGTRTTSTLPAGVHRIRWIPGTDLLLARCFCGREEEFDDPVRLWDWLLAHPEDEPYEHDGPVRRHGEGEHQ